MVQRFRLTYPMVLLVCFFCGTASGTILANSLGSDLLVQSGYAGYDCVLNGKRSSGHYAASGTGGTGFTVEQKCRLWGCVAGQRFSEFGFAALIGLTPLAAGGFAVLIFLGGLICGLTISVATLQRGLMGIPVCLLAMFPHWLCYLPVWQFMAVKAETGLSGLRLRIWPVLALLAAAGTFLEAYVNPFFFRL